MSMFDKFKEIIGGSDYDEDFDDIEEVDEEEEVEEVEPIISKQRGNKVVNIHNSASAKVMVVKPNSYDEAREIAIKVSKMLRSKKNYLSNAFRPDFSSPSTHLLYGYWVGATPDGRHSREMLGYGVDPLYGDASNGMGFRVLSAMDLPYDKMNGGYASHFGVDPNYFKGETLDQKGAEFGERVIAPLFFNKMHKGISPFYLYVNVTTPQTLRKVLADPKKYAPSGVYIMRIHGTFVNFLDLSPAIQQDIIKRLDPCSASM